MSEIGEVEVVFAAYVGVHGELVLEDEVVVVDDVVEGNHAL